MTNNIELIEEKTGYTVGKIKLGEYVFQECNKEKPIIFDTTLGNFHLLPIIQTDKEKKLIDIANCSIKNKRDSLIDLIGEQISANKIQECRINKRYGIARSNVIKECGGRYIFNYIRVESKRSDLVYDLMFIRFYLSGKEVNCNLCSYQFSLQKAEAYSCYAYPESEEGGRGKKYWNNIEYYNPKTEYIIDNDSDLNKIVEEFCDYINENEAQ